jgi:hypothetical protein
MVSIPGFAWALIAAGVVSLPLYSIFLEARRRDVYGVLRGLAGFFILGFAACVIAWFGVSYFGPHVGDYLYRGLSIFLAILGAPIFCYGCMRLYTDIKSGMLSRLEIIERVVLLACWAGLLYSAYWVVFRGETSLIMLFSVPLLFVHCAILLYRRSIARKTH